LTYINWNKIWQKYGTEAMITYVKLTPNADIYKTKKVDNIRKKLLNKKQYNNNNKNENKSNLAAQVECV